MTLARDRAQSMGITTEQAFERLVTGLGRGSAKILDDLGIVVHVTAINDTYAASIGKTADALTDAEKKQALINEVMRQGAASAASSGGAIEGNAASVQRLGASFENLKEKAGGGLANAVAPAINAVSDLANGFDGTAKTAATWINALEGIGRSMQSLPPQTAQVQAAQESFAASVLSFIGIASGVPPVMSTMAGAFDEDRQAAAALANTIPATATAINDGTTAVNTGTMAIQAHAAEYAMLIGVTQQSVEASMADAAAKDELAAKTGLLTAQATAAIAAFMQLHPNISAAGVAAMAAAGQIDPLLAQLIQATLRAREAAQALAAFNALQGVKASRVVAGEQEAEIAGMKHAAVVADQTERAKTNAARSAAENQRTIAVGTHDQKVALAQKEYDAAVKLHGAGSVEAYQYQTKLLQAQEQGASKRASSAGAAGDKIAGIEQKTGDKIAQIVENTQKKITAIDEREAAKQAAALEKLNAAIATTAADRRASNEADDLDLIGVKDSKEAAKLNDRERAEAASRAREKTAADEARATAAAGDAELAQKQYDVRENQINAQQQLDEKYYAKQRELAQDPATQEALKQQYDEATRANDEAAQTRIAIAQAESDQKKAAVQAEKDAVVAAANDQANQVAAAAERGMGAVKNATGEAKAKGVADLHAIGDAVNAIPATKTITITVNQQGNVSAGSTGGGGGGGGTNKAAGGGSFMTKGKTSLTVGDNPGGVELVSVTPISGRGQSSASGNLVAMAGGGTVLVDAGGGYTTPVAGVPIAGAGGKGGAGGRAGAVVSVKDQIAAQKEVIDLLSSLIKLRSDLEDAIKNGQPFNVAFIDALAKKASQFVQIVEGHLLPITKKDNEALKAYADGVRSAVDVISAVAQLRHQMQDNIGDQPFDMTLINGLANRAAQFVTIVQARLIPTSQAAADQVKRYADAVGSTVSMLKNVTELGGKLFEDYTSPTDAQINMLANDAKRVATGVMRAAATYKADGLTAGKAYAETVGATFSAFKDGLLFFDALKSGDFKLDVGALNAFEKSTNQTLQVAKRLGATAATIPASDIAALSRTTAALAAQSEALIKLAAVPFGDLSGASSGLSQQANRLLGGAGGGTSVMVNVYGAPGMDVNALANAVITKINQQTGARR
jgi:hypothetical protein